MGQKLDSMNNHNNKRSEAELLYEMVHTGNVEAIRALHKNGATLEWSDEEGMTPLILACMNPSLVHVAKLLIQLGANVNAYRSGPDGGTPLHHAAKRGSEQIVELLLSHRANALVRNDNHQTPLDVARSEKHANIVRVIENHICCFSGWMREFNGPWFLEAVTPQLVSRNVWVVVVPYAEEPLKLEMMTYPTQEDSQPRAVIALWKSKIDKPDFDQCDPKLTIFNKFSRTKYKLASGVENDKQQLQSLYTACRGIRQIKLPSAFSHSRTLSLDFSQPTAEASNSAMLSGASVQSKVIDTNGWGNLDDCNSQNGWGSSLGARHSLEVNTNGWMDKPATDDSNSWGLCDSKPVGQSAIINQGSSCGSSNYKGWGTSLGATHSSEVNTNGWLELKPAKDDDYNGWGLLLDSKQVNQSKENAHGHDNNASAVYVSSSGSGSASVLSMPSAPPIPDEVLTEGLIRYTSIDSSALDVPAVPSMVEASVTQKSLNSVTRDSSCAICWDAPIEGACIPCGHMAGCMACLNEIKVNKGVCPICKARMDQVVRLYAV